MGQRELLGEYRRASALCMPSRLLPDDRDGIPNVLVEAMAAGTPVVASAVSGIPELVEHEVNGLLVAPEDPEQLADSLVRLHADPELALRLAEHGRDTVRDRFDGAAARGPPRRPVPWGDRVRTALRPRPVVCVTEHEHRSRATADDVLAGRFTVAGETRDLGPDPDWRGSHLPEDEEWRIEWVKFAWGLDLAHAGHGEAWERLTASWIDAARPRRGRARGHRPPDPELDLRVAAARPVARPRRAAARQPRGPGPPRAREPRARAATTARSSCTRCSSPASRSPSSRTAGALDLLHENLAADFRPDGVHVEASTHYHCIALRSFVGVLANAPRAPLPPGFAERVERARRFAAHCRRPDGTIPALSDADTGDYSALLTGDPDELDVSFPDGGYHVQRSGWDPGASFLIFDCGPLGDGGHGHYDLLSFEAHANGRPLVIDPGRGAYAEPRAPLVPRHRRAQHRLRRRARPDAVHARAPRRAGRPRPLELGDGDVLEGEARSPAYEAVHRRRITSGDGWIVEDDLRGEREHRYDLRFHLPPGEAHVQGNTVLAPGVALTIEGATPTLEQGWIAPRYGELIEAPVVSAATTGRDARFTTHVRPR